jgi:glycosyltransferase involved in cell wall biosynthesis
VVTTIHGPFNDELTDLYSALAPGSPSSPSPTPSSGRADVPIARVIHHGLDASAFPFGDGGGDEDGEYLLFLGRMAPTRVRTGPSRSPASRRHSGSSWRPRCASRGSAPTSTEQVAPLLGPDAVYLGEVPHERKLELLANARALLFPIRWNEPFGMVMLEAMACGTPVLAFPEGAAPEVIDDGTTGFLCDDENAMVDALGRLGELRRQTAGRRSRATSPPSGWWPSTSSSTRSWPRAEGASGDRTRSVAVRG